MYIPPPAVYTNTIHNTNTLYIIHYKYTILYYS